MKVLHFVLFVMCYELSLIDCAVMHSHSDNNLNREREQDGAYSPRDKHHSPKNSEHHSEFDHESILGSAKEAEEFDHLPPDESKRRLTILLTKMDIDKDRHIDRKELKAWILRSFKMLSEEEAQERLEDADENRDGKISWAEYISDVYGKDSSEENLPIDIQNEQLLEDDKMMWKVADKNHDGVLDSLEWLAFSHPEEHPDMLPHILSQTLKDKDSNNDGAIDFQEYVGERGREHNKEWLEAEKDRFDNELDKDGDGKLNNYEILSWVVPSNDEIAEEEVAHLFASSDDDNDNILSFDEVLEHHDIFVGSEATDYGDHLHNIHHFQDEL